MPSSRKSAASKKKSTRRSPAKRPLTQAELAARRANAARSTGPRTGAGKRRSAANALRSTGPRTPGGKRRSARNSTRHGLNAQAFLLPSEDPVEFQAHLRRWEDELRPVGDAETRLVHHLARLQWKLRRVLDLERDIFTPRFDPAAPHIPPLDLTPAPPNDRPAPMIPLTPLHDLYFTSPPSRSAPTASAAPPSISSTSSTPSTEPDPAPCGSGHASRAPSPALRNASTAPDASTASTASTPSTALPPHIRIAVRRLRRVLGPRRHRHHPIVALTRYETPLQKAYHDALLLLHACQERRLNTRPDPSATPGSVSSHAPDSPDADLPDSPDADLPDSPDADLPDSPDADLPPRARP